MTMRHVAASFIAGAVLALTGGRFISHKSSQQTQLRALQQQNKSMCLQLKQHHLKLPGYCK